MSDPITLNVFQLWDFPSENREPRLMRQCTTFDALVKFGRKRIEKENEYIGQHSSLDDGFVEWPSVEDPSSAMPECVECTGGKDTLVAWYDPSSEDDGSTWVFYIKAGVVYIE